MVVLALTQDRFNSHSCPGRRAKQTRHICFCATGRPSIGLGYLQQAIRLTFMFSCVQCCPGICTTMYGSSYSAACCTCQRLCDESLCILTTRAAGRSGCPRCSAALAWAKGRRQRASNDGVGTAVHKRRRRARAPSATPWTRTYSCGRRAWTLPPAPHRRVGAPLGAAIRRTHVRAAPLDDRRKRRAGARALRHRRRVGECRPVLPLSSVPRRWWQNMFSWAGRVCMPLNLRIRGLGKRAAEFLDPVRSHAEDAGGRSVSRTTRPLRGVQAGP
jgi:hypothetical protein